MGMTDKVVGTGVFSFFTLGGDGVAEDKPADPKEELPEEQPPDGVTQPPPAPANAAAGKK